jgi:V8-like Glu-specific endopeptidase
MRMLREVSRTLAGAALLVLLATGCTSSSSAASTSTSLATEWGSAVNIGWYYIAEDGEEYGCGGGSGTLVGDTTTVLTAAHVIAWTPEDEQSCPGAELWVGYPVEARGQYFVWWKATVTASDETLDVALLSVDLTGTPDGADDADGAIASIRDGSWGSRPIAAEDAGPNLGDPLHVLSYPGIGGYGITYTAGNAAGWAYINDEETGKEFEYLKLDLTIAGGSSGAGVLNDRGELVGVVIQGGADWESDVVDCRKLADTNEDGEVTDADTCIPFGGFINAALSLYDVRVFLGQHGVLVEAQE